MAMNGSRFSDFSAMIDPDLLAVLVCPVTRTALIYDEERQELISEAAGVAYPVRDGVPVMLIEEARVIAPQTATP